LITSAFSFSVCAASYAFVGHSSNKPQTTTSPALTSAPYPSDLGQAVTFTAPVTAASGTPAIGTVTFSEGGNTLGTGTLTALSGKDRTNVVSDSTLSPRRRPITATYTHRSVTGQPTASSQPGHTR